MDGSSCSVLPPALAHAMDRLSCVAAVVALRCNASRRCKCGDVKSLWMHCAHAMPPVIYHMCTFSTKLIVLTKKNDRCVLCVQVHACQNQVRATTEIERWKLPWMPGTQPTLWRNNRDHERTIVAYEMASFVICDTLLHHTCNSFPQQTIQKD